MNRRVIFIPILVAAVLLFLQQAGLLHARVSVSPESGLASLRDLDSPDSLFEVFPLARGLHSVYQYRYSSEAYLAMIPIGGSLDSGMVTNTVRDSLRTSDTTATWNVEEVSTLWHQRWGYLGDTSYSTHDTVTFLLYESTVDSHEVRGSGKVWNFPHSSLAEHIYRYSHGPSVLILNSGVDPGDYATDSIRLAETRGLFYRSLWISYGPGTPYRNSTVGQLAVTLQGTPVVSVTEHGVPAHATSLEQNYPNPFNPSTTFRYALAQRSHVMLTVFNTLGQEVATLVNAYQEAGYHDIKFDGSSLASGVYFCRLRSEGYVATMKMLLIR